MDRDAALRRLLGTLQPRRNAGIYAFVTVSGDFDAVALRPLATFREPGDTTLVVEESRARAAGLPVQFRAAWLTLGVHSDLAAVGLTAAVASALACAGIACNVIAATHHDHLFVPLDAADTALAVLNALQQSAASGR
jgi:hypothetical protein